MPRTRRAEPILAATSLAILMLLTGCAAATEPAAVASTSTAAPTAPPTSTQPPGTTSTSTAAKSGAGPETVAPSTGDGSRPTVVSFDITPRYDAPCEDGKVLATMSWKVTPATATVTIRDMGGFANPTSNGETLGPFASEGTLPVPAFVKCDGLEHNVILEANNGGPAFVGKTGSVASKAP